MATEAGKFLKSSYDKNDSYAKDIFLKYIKKRGHEIISTEETYNHDIITMKNNKKFYFELEIKRNYPFETKESFNFPTVSFLGRKKRLHNIKPFKYILICHETDYAIGCNSKDIFLEKYKENININRYQRKGNDNFYRVPKEKCLFFKIR